MSKQLKYSLTIEYHATLPNGAWATGLFHSQSGRTELSDRDRAILERGVRELHPDLLSVQFTVIEVKEN